MNFSARELTFCLKDKGRFDEDALRKALKAEGFQDVQVKAGPAAPPGAAAQTP